MKSLFISKWGDDGQLLLLLLESLDCCDQRFSNGSSLK